MGGIKKIGTVIIKTHCNFAGAKIAQYAGRHLHKHIVNSMAYEEGRYEDAMREAFLRIDQTMMEDTELMEEMSGTTAVTALLKNNTLYVVSQYF